MSIQQHVLHAGKNGLVEVVTTAAKDPKGRAKGVNFHKGLKSLGKALQKGEDQVEIGDVIFRIRNGQHKKLKKKTALGRSFARFKEWARLQWARLSNTFQKENFKGSPFQRHLIDEHFDDRGLHQNSLRHPFNGGENIQRAIDQKIYDIETLPIKTFKLTLDNQPQDVSFKVHRLAFDKNKDQLTGSEFENSTIFMLHPSPITINGKVVPLRNVSVALGPTKNGKYLELTDLPIDRTELFKTEADIAWYKAAEAEIKDLLKAEQQKQGANLPIIFYPQSYTSTEFNHLSDYLNFGFEFAGQDAAKWNEAAKPFIGNTRLGEQSYNNWRETHSEIKKAFKEFSSATSWLEWSPPITPD